MRFSTIFLSSVVAALSVQAQANNGTQTTVSPAVSGTAKPNAGQQAAAVCLESCPDNDNECRAKCQLLANSVNPIGDCQAACPKGDGKAAGNLNYKECIQNCATISATPTSAEETSAADSTAKPTGTGSDSGSNSGTGSGSGDSTSGSGSDVKASGTDAAPSSTPTGAAANMAVSVSVGAGLSLFAMMLAL